MRTIQLRVSVLGGIAILVPGFARLKEWAYAGIVFDLTGAAFSSTAVGNAWWHVLAPLSVATIAVASWALRPSDRLLGTVQLVRPSAGTHDSAG